MKTTDKEVIWDLEKRCLTLTSIECARVMAFAGNKPITMINVRSDELGIIARGLEYYYTVGMKLDKIMEKLGIPKDEK